MDEKKLFHELICLEILSAMLHLLQTSVHILTSAETSGKSIWLWENRKKKKIRSLFSARVTNE